MSYGQIAVNGTPGNTQRDLERLCEIEVGHERSEPNRDTQKPTEPKRASADRKERRQLRTMKR